ncbi:MAG TPA: alpha/beta fold hydrolase [Candidatus Babeliales bacterium]|nr:alpha/beta fold hydrolase [Candidatus Babeliales bacterium]
MNIKINILIFLFVSGPLLADCFDFSSTISAHMIKEPELVKATDDIDLAYYSFTCKNPKAIVLSFHGSGIYSCGIYQEMAQSLADTYNINTILVDRRGHGNSQGPRGDAPSPQQVWQDIDTVINLVKSNYPGLPVFLIGHSSGAGLILNYLNWKEYKNEVDGYIFIAPYLGTNAGTVKDRQDGFIKHARVWALIGYGISRGWLFAHIPALFFNYPDWVKKQDNHVLSYYTPAMVFADSPYDVVHIFKQLKKPCAIFIGQEDEQFNAEAVISFAQYIVPKHSASIIPQAKHLSIITQSAQLCADAINEFLQ